MGLPVTLRGLTGADWPFVMEHASPVLCKDTDGVVAVRGTELVGAAIFDSFSSNSCLSHVIVLDPLILRHRFLEMGFMFAFGVKQVNLITGLTPADNEAALRFNKRIGFREVYRIPEGYKVGVDFVLQEMRRDECRWIRSSNRRAA